MTASTSFATDQRPSDGPTAKNTRRSGCRGRPRFRGTRGHAEWQRVLPAVTHTIPSAATTNHHQISRRQARRETPRRLGFRRGVLVGTDVWSAPVTSSTPRTGPRPTVLPTTQTPRKRRIGRLDPPLEGSLGGGSSLLWRGLVGSFCLWGHRFHTIVAVTCRRQWSETAAGPVTGWRRS